MADTRTCEQCGTVFTPRREHARFCSVRCRITWNRQHAGSLAASQDTLDWAITAMRDTASRLLQARGWNQPDTFAVITETVWWVTLVDATIVRYHPAARSRALARHSTAERAIIENTFGGLRFVRNQLGYGVGPYDFIQAYPGNSREPAARVAAWTWKPVPAPEFPALPPQGQQWETTRYHSYQAQLVGHPIGVTFTRATSFIQLATLQFASE